MNQQAQALGALHALSDGFAARDVARCLACYTSHPDISYLGSEAGELGHGRRAVRALLTELFRRPEAYSWHATTVTVHPAGDLLHITADATGLTSGDDGTRQQFPYRLSGLLQPDTGRLRWRVVVGAEPAPPG